MGASSRLPESSRNELFQAKLHRKGRKGKAKDMIAISVRRPQVMRAVWSGVDFKSCRSFLETYLL
jgi:hypothetical protein